MIKSPIQILQQNNTFEDADKSIRAMRKFNIMEYWKLYSNEHWDYSELDSDKPTIARNKIKSIINKVITHAVGRTPYITYFNEEVEALLKPYVDLLLEYTGGMSMLAYETFLTGCVTGDAFIKAVYDQRENKVKLQVQQSQAIDAYYDYLDNSTYIPDLVTLVYKKANKIVNENGDIDLEYVDYKEVWDSNTVRVYEDGKLRGDLSGENLLGKTPFVHIRNQIIDKSPFGRSDVEDMKDLNLLYNNSLRGFNDIVDYMGEPWMLAYGYKLKDVDKNGTRVLSNLPPKTEGTDTQFLTLDTDLPATLRFLKILEEGIHEQGGVPLSSANGKTAMSNVSGTAYHYDMYPITETVDRKLLIYQAGLSKALSLGLELMYFVAKKNPKVVFASIVDIADKIKNIHKGLGTVNSLSKVWSDVKVEFYDYLQKDELSRTNNIILKVNNKLISRRSAMKELGISNIDQELEFIKAEMNLNIEETNIGSNELKNDFNEKSSSIYATEENDNLRQMEKLNEKG